jgi:hypothetical protein
MPTPSRAASIPRYPGCSAASRSIASDIAAYPLSPGVRSDVKITATYGGAGVGAIPSLIAARSPQ